MISLSALFVLLVCSLWCLALVEAEHYKFIWKAEDPLPPKTFTKFVVTFKGGAEGLQHETFAANEGEDNNIFELQESQCPEGASIFHINAHYSEDGFIGAFHNELVGNKPNEEGITVIKLIYNVAVAHQPREHPSGGAPFDIQRSLAAGSRLTVKTCVRSNKNSQ